MSLDPSMPDNQAAWLTRALGQLDIAEAPYPTPADDQVVVRNRAVAVNPLE